MAHKLGKVVWQGDGLAFEGSVPSGASLKFNNIGDDFRPLELVMVALAGCTAMDVIDILRKKRQAVIGLEVAAHGETADEHPHKYTAIEVKYTIIGENIDASAVERAIELSETKYCAVMATLRAAAPVKTSYEIKQQQTASS